MSVLIVTSLGDIVVDLFTEKCPLTCKNFLKLCKIKYYHGCLFHTVQKDFTAQTGDPTGTGSGGDSVYKFLYGDQARFFGDEIHHDIKHSKTGTVAMASAGENLNASQFYFTLRDDLDYLDGKHTVFGEVAEGLETLTRINEAYVDEKSRPYKNIRIKHTHILDDPFDDPPQLSELIPGASPEGKPKDEVDDDVRLEDDWVPMDEQLGASELEEVLRAKDAHSSAVVLESVGDIPDAEIKPPENVLFVCKLNPVTEDEDLHTIFSRFGTVVSAEVIRDYKTGDSLCYAFIEFETNEACEQAYFKMDNALIDDRRIHVDFSQSVAKLWSQYRRKDQQKGKGGGCFKCGSIDHVAKDCTGGPSTQLQNSKYILKDENAQHGGDNSSRYEMVFDGDAPETPQQGKMDLSHESDGNERRYKINRKSSHTMEGKNFNDKDKQRNRSRDYRADMSRSGGWRDEKHLKDQFDGERHVDRQRGRDEQNHRKSSSDIRRDDRRGDAGNRKRYADDNSPPNRRQDEHRKRSRDDDGYTDKKGESDYLKKYADSNRRHSRNESSYRRSGANDHGHKDRREERTDRHRRTKSDDDHDRDRRWYRRTESDDDHDRDKRSQEQKKSPRSKGFIRPRSLSSIRPLEKTRKIALPATAQLTHGQLAHSSVFKLGLDADSHTTHSLITMYARCSELGSARKVFDEITERDLVSWNSMISGYSKMGQASEAVGLFGKMREEGFVPDEMTLVSVLGACGDLGDLSLGMWVEGFVVKHKMQLSSYIGSALIDMYGKCGDLVSARRVFDGMLGKDVVTWNAMITGYAQNGMSDEAIKLFHGMNDAGVNPDKRTLAGVLSACASIGALELGKWTDAYASQRGLQHDIFVSTALVDMYAKCGSLDDARRVFENMPIKNEVSWNAMISALAFHGRSQEALSLFERMSTDGTDACPNDVTFVGVLSACVHAGLVNEGWRYFNLMNLSYGLTPKIEHYSCMVDLLSRAGQLYEAWDFIEKMPEKPDAIVLGALLGACQKSKNLDLSEKVMLLLLQMEPSNSGNYVISSKIYAKSRRWDESAQMRALMRHRGVSKTPGCSWLDIEGQLHEFLARDDLLYLSSELHQVFELLNVEMKREGYIPKVGFHGLMVFPDVLSSSSN
ncbi:PCMP-E23: Pentatricopeptide repeat-containing protein [Gossypium arboreum]|uniref:peptidylprolyl isomerase n=1 Tax=Gossypium arboreum TaxID=29729 RepID=A0A0B0MAZ0_GOSAR|nr:PCMP-E23: Pentatricopeptide repeat-containing protein [Gossypium arboreum]